MKSLLFVTLTFFSVISYSENCLDLFKGKSPSGIDVIFEPSFVSNRHLVLSPTGNAFESARVYNPAMFVKKDLVNMIYRAEGHNTGSGALGFSWSEDGINFIRHKDNPVLKASETEGGIEDPRIVKFGDEYYLFFISVVPDERGQAETRASIQLATSRDLVNWERKGEILSSKNSWETKQVKAPTPVPIKINGKYWFYYLGEREAWSRPCQHAYVMAPFWFQCLLWTKDTTGGERGYGKSGPIHHSCLLFPGEDDISPGRIQGRLPIEGWQRREGLRCPRVAPQKTAGCKHSRPCVPMSPTRASRWSDTMGITAMWLAASGKSRIMTT